MIINTIRGLMKDEIEDEELVFILEGIEQDIFRNRLFSAKPKKTRLWYIMRVAVKLHEIWIRSQHVFTDEKFERILSDKQLKNVIKYNSIRKKTNVL